MNRWLRRLLIFFIILVWLLIMSFPVVALVLASQEQIQIGADPNRHLRIFLVQEDEADGVGFEWARTSRSNSACTKTSVNYLLWEGEAEPASFCQCYDPLTGDLLAQELFDCKK
jgi:hypothetical protein